MPVEWERIPDGVPEDFQALNGNEIVGRSSGAAIRSRLGRSGGFGSGP
jgi:hypothetical protein